VSCMNNSMNAVKAMPLPGNTAYQSASKES